MPYPTWPRYSSSCSRCQHLNLPRPPPEIKNNVFIIFLTQKDYTYIEQLYTEANTSLFFNYLIVYLTNE